jgi:hypothetical protein
MSNTKHTPGPWFGSHSPVTKSKLSGRWFKSVKNKKSIGGIIIANGFGDTKEQAEANTKLIAAAPELLEALDELRTAIIDCVDSEWWGRHKETVAKAYEAIKKATE